jgi:uncharacterized membrane protein (DUF2068 family)
VLWAVGFVGRNVKDIHNIFPVVKGVGWGEIVNINVNVIVIVIVVMICRREIILRLRKGIHGFMGDDWTEM